MHTVETAETLERPHLADSGHGSRGKERLLTDRFRNWLQLPAGFHLPHMLKLRRRVFGVAALYIVAAWVGVQVADQAIEAATEFLKDVPDPAHARPPGSMGYVCQFSTETGS